MRNSARGLDRTANRYVGYRRAEARYQEYDDEPVGFFSRTAMLLLRHPFRTGAAVVSVLALAVIVTNAAFLQAVRHPSPLLATRPAAEPVAAALPDAEVPVPRSRTEAVAAVEPRRVHVTPVEPPRRDAAAGLVAEAQKALSEAGYYRGAIDGLFGLGTRGAIEAFQRDRGLAVTGSVSEELLVALREGGTREVTGAVAPTAADRLRALEEALNDIGYGPIEADGILDAATADAIRRFQLDNGLDLTGEPDSRFVQKMVDIGALSPI